MRYRPNDDEAACAWTVAQRRNTLNNGDRVDLGITEEESLRQHYTACLAEIAVSRILNLCWTGCGKGERDVGGMWEVRSTTTRGYGLIIRDRDDEAAPFILVYVDPASRWCELQGWESGAEVRHRGKMLDAHAWVLPPDDLLPLDAVPKAA